MSRSPVVYIVDDDDAVRGALKLLLETVGLACEAFSLGGDFLAAYDPKRRCCLVSDIRMPGMSGLDLQRELNELHIDVPIIFITGHGDVPMAVSAMKSGATDFIQKPFRDQHLIDRIQKALNRSANQWASRPDDRSCDPADDVPHRPVGEVSREEVAPPVGQRVRSVHADDDKD